MHCVLKVTQLNTEDIQYFRGGLGTEYEKRHKSSDRKGRRKLARCSTMEEDSSCTVWLPSRRLQLELLYSCAKKDFCSKFP